MQTEDEKLQKVATRLKAILDRSVFVGNKNFSILAEEYVEAGESLFANHKDKLGVPTLSLLRQGVELSMKAVLQELKKHGNRTGEFNISVPTHHDLEKIRVDVELAVELASQHFPIRGYTSIESSYITDFANLDPSGQVWRYLKNKKGEPYFVGTPYVELSSRVNGAKKLLEAMQRIDIQIPLEPPPMR